jgi:hypothetical protein
MSSKDKNILAYFIKGYIENGLTYDEEIRKIVVYLQAKRLLSLRYHVI